MKKTKKIGVGELFIVFRSQQIINKSWLSVVFAQQTTDANEKPVCNGIEEPTAEVSNTTVIAMKKQTR